MPNFLKLYAKCYDCTIPAGNYSILVKMNYPKTMFAGRRALVFSTTSGLGSGSYFISTAYMVVGGISLIFATGFLIHMLICPRPFGDLSHIWAKQQQAQQALIFRRPNPLQRLKTNDSSQDSDDSYSSYSSSRSHPIQSQTPDNNNHE